MAESNIIIENNDSIRTITINRPKQLNALNSQTINELSEALKDAEKENSVKAIILTGSGEKAFVAGADIKEFASFSVEEGKKLSKEGHDKLFDLAQNLSTPIIAAINGFALGGGLELAMSAHIRVASDNAKMGLPEVSLGVIPGYGGTQRLAQLVGRGKAMEMIATAGMISADDAHNWGLVNHVTTPEGLLEQCNKIAGKIVKNSSSAISLAIIAVNANYVDGVDGFATEIQEFGNCFGTDDFKEGTTAFIERRKANFK
ncbi:enoyl-CoA hydratase-related protein [Flavobacteriales bacterium]|jgi:enoyl-CoA hydratase|nr:enoyl-CoA hydratase-related protein [bacterium]MDB9931169.1 enoyl-CoA hydratase-related protein [Flavobacteriales bacterium]MDC1370779.1 enoyl-CoA hydratase-related protein [Flavobacteriales bacterium]MDG1176395.1 enoyl-CoA hydratase-related protein [Flavobacteriales bacterium]